jgi:hypothetical protein
MPERRDGAPRTTHLGRRISTERLREPVPKLPLPFGLSLFALLLVVTLGLKVVTAVSPAHTQTHALPAAIAAFLDAHGYRVLEVNRETDSSLALVSAAKGPTCRVLVAEARPQGWNRNDLRLLAGPGDQLFVVFGGLVYADQPTRLTTAYYHWDRFHRQIGFQVPARPVLAVASSPGCHAEALPWGELAGRA